MKNNNQFAGILIRWSTGLIAYATFVTLGLRCKDMGTVQPGNSTHIEINVQPTSIWFLHSTKDVIVLSEKSGDMTITLDWTSVESDGACAGIYIKTGSVPFEGLYGFGRAACFIPDIALTQDYLSISSTDSAVRIIMKGLAYKDIKETGVDSLDKLPITMSAMIQPTAKGFVISLQGMYYILLPKDQAALKFVFGQPTKLDSAYVEQTSPRLIKYFDDTRSVEVSNKNLGRWSILTDASRLQLDIPEPSWTSFTMFELDFDHSYKDFGQMSVSTVVTVRLIQ